MATGMRRAETPDDLVLYEDDDADKAWQRS